MKKLSISLFVLGIFLAFGVGRASAATYCVKPDGTCLAANKSNAVVTNAAACTAQTTAANALSVTTMNGSSFAAGDTVYFSGLNTSLAPTNYGSTRIVIPTSGSDSSHLVTYQGITDGAGVGGCPQIAMTGATGAFYDGAKSYISFSNFDIEYAGSTGTVQHVYLAGSNVTVSNITINGVGYGYGVYLAGGESNITLSNITISNVSLYSVQVIAGAGNSNISINNLTTSSGRGMSIAGTNGLTLTDVTSNSTTSLFDSLTITGASGVVSVLRYNSTNSGNVALSIYNSTPTSISITNPIITGATYAKALFLQNVNSSSINLLNGSVHDNLGTGIYIDQSPNTVIQGFNPLNITNGGIYNNGLSTNSSSGISISNTTGNSNNMIIADNWIYNNGYPDTSESLGNCDGIDFHASCSNETVHNNIIVHNGNSGFAFVLDSSGVAYNNVLANNGTNTYTNRGGYYNSGSGAWTMKNNIFYQNYPYEENVTSVIPTSDHNLFYHTINANMFYNSAIPANYTFATWKSTYNQDLNSKNADPLFTNGSTSYSLTSDFYLQGGSVARGIADGSVLTGTASVFDINTTRITDAAGNLAVIPDIGAYQSQPRSGMGMGF